MPDLPASLISSADNLFQTLLEVSLTAVKLMRPVVGPGDEVADFAFEYINPAGQTMTGLPERPDGTLLSLLPPTLAAELLPFYRRVFATSQADQHHTIYQRDGVTRRVLVAAQRSGQLLVVNLTEAAAADRDLSAVEQALRESQAREREARTMAEVQHQQLDTLIMQAPACIARLAGPSHTFTVANPLYHQLFGGRELVGKDIREALPELASEPFFGLLDTVYRTGETFYGNEIPIYFDESADGHSEPQYFNFINQATQDASGKVDGILVYAYDVTEQVRARQMLEHNKTQLQALNGELEEANKKLGAATRQAEEARAEADLQRQQLYNILMQAPAMICMFEGPEHRFKLINPAYQQLVGERPLLGQPIHQAMPELTGQPIFDLLDRVYRTGETFYAQEMLVQLDHANKGSHLGENYYNFVYQATRDLAGTVGGILVFAYEVTPQVKARRQVELSRQQVQILNEELATANEELKAANEEFLATNAELVRTQQQLQHLNADLESRVLERTQALQRAQTEADRQRQRLERLFMQAPAAICILGGPNLVFELANPGYQELFTRRQLLNKPILEAMPEIEGNRVYETLRHVYEVGGTHQEQNLLISFARPEDGVIEDRYFNFIQQARYDEHGQIDGVLVFAFEVTEQVRAQQEAEYSEARFRRLAETTPMIVWEADAAGHTTYLSPHWEQFTVAANGQGLSWKECIHPDDQEPFVEAWLTAVRTQQTFQAEVRLRLAATGEYRWYLDRAVPVRDAANVVVQWVGAATDIHEQKLAAKVLQRLTYKLRKARDEGYVLNKELEATNQQLRRTNVDLDNFIYTASHDLKVAHHQHRRPAACVGSAVARYQPRAGHNFHAGYDARTRWTASNDHRPPERRSEAAKRARAARR